MKQLDTTGRCASRDVWSQMCDIIVKTLLCVQPKLSATYKSFFGENDAAWGPKCFEVLGFDIMLDASGRAWLFEVNHAPSFATGSPLDREIKRALIASTLALVGVTNEKKRAFLRRDRLEWAKRLWKTQPAVGSKKPPTHDTAKSRAVTEAVVSQQQQQRQQQRRHHAVASKTGNDSAVPVGSPGRPEEEPDGQKPLDQERPGVDNSNGDAGDVSDDNDSCSNASSESSLDSGGPNDTDDESDNNTSQRHLKQSGGRLSKDGATLLASTLSLLSATPAAVREAAAEATASVKLPVIRAIFQKKNRVSPCGPETMDLNTKADIVGVASPVASTLISSDTATGAPECDILTATSVFFTNDFEQLYPVTDSSAGPADGDATTAAAASRRIQYETILAAAQVNRSKLWG